jgi:hypothetical protein
MRTALRRDQTVDDYRLAAGDPFVVADGAQVWSASTR